MASEKQETALLITRKGLDNPANTPSDLVIQAIANNVFVYQNYYEFQMPAFLFITAKH